MRILEGRAAESYVRETGAARDRSWTRWSRECAALCRACGGMGTGRCGDTRNGGTGLAPAMRLRVPESEMQAALKSFVAGTAGGAGDCGRQHPQFLRMAETSRVGASRSRAGSWASWCGRCSSVGCYVPGGRYPLPSTLLMTVIPAQVAGVKEIRVVSPRPAQATLAAAALLGVREFYRVGGAQAIAALAYGTKSVPRVNKIVGPGNLFVTDREENCGVRLRHRFSGGADRGADSLRRGRAVFHRGRSGGAGRA